MTPPERIFAELDALSRTRALTDAESLSLEQAMAYLAMPNQRRATRVKQRGQA